MTIQVRRTAARSFVLLLTWLCALAAVGAAQTEKIQLRLVPHPDQWVQYQMTMDIAMAPAQSGAAKGSPVPDMSVRMAMAFTQTTAHADQDGNVKAEVTFDDVSTTATVAGKETPVPMPASFLGQQMTAIYDAQGKLVDLQAPPEMQASVGQMRQMMTSAFAGFPTSAIAVGETVSMPLNLPLPVSAGGSGSNLQGTNTMTLRSITQEAGERIAHFDQTTKLSLATTTKLPSRDAAAAAPTMTLSVQMSGTGTMDYNVDLGIVVRNNMQSTIDSVTKFDGPMPKGMPGMDMHGTVKLTMTATY